MKAFGLLSFFSLLCAGQVVYGGVVLDQDYVTRLKWAFQAYSDQWVGQQFTAGRAGTITRIEADLGADMALQADLTVHLVNTRSGVRKTVVWPAWKIPRSNQYYLAGLDVAAQGFQVQAGDVCQMLFTSALPWGTRPAVSVLGGCAAPEGAYVCSPGVGNYPGGSVLQGTSLTSLYARDEDIGFRTFVSNGGATGGAPVLYEGPEGMERWTGQRLWLPAFALGAEPIVYTWYRNNEVVASGPTPQYEIATVRPEHAGDYYVVASNAAGSATSRVAKVQVQVGPMIQGTREVLALVGHSIELNPYVVSIGTISYEWLFRGAVVGRGASYAIASPTLNHSGDYTLRATDSTGTTEWVTTLVVRDDRSKIKWTRALGESPMAPTVAPSGNIYVAKRYGLWEYTPAGVGRYFGSANAPQVAAIVVGDIGVMTPERWGSVTKFDGTLLRTWEFPDSYPLFAVNTNGVGFFVESTGHVRAHNFVTGQSLWDKPMTVGPYWADPTYDPVRDIVYVTLEGKRICALDGRNGDLLWDYPSEWWIQRDACIGADGTYYVASTNLFAFEARTGRIKWQRPLAASGMAVTADGRLFFCADGSAYALNARTGETIWSKPFTRYSIATPTLLSDGTVLYVSLENLISALSMANGDLVWDCLIPSNLTGPVAVGLDGTIYATCWDANLYALNTTAPLLPGPWSRTRGGTLNNNVMNASAAPPPEPVLIEEPGDLTVRIGAAARLQVSASSPTPLSYVWTRNGVEIPNANGTSIEIAAAGWNDGGFYVAEVSNEFGRVQSRRARVTIDPGTVALVSAVAGDGQAGYLEGTGEGARFNLPDGIAALDGNSVAVTDVNNNVLRRVDGNGAVTRLAGVTAGGYGDGPALEALFTEPFGVFARGSDIYVADSGNRRVRRIRDGVTSTIAGSGEAGYLDGPAAEAKFRFPNDLTADGAGNVFVTEFENHTVRRIKTDGTVETWAGTGTAGFRDGPAAEAQFNGPAGIALGPDGSLFVTDWNNHRVRKISADRMVTTLAGGDATGRIDGFGAEARLTAPNGIVYSPEGVLYITDFANVIRRVSLVGQVTTVAGNGTAGWVDGFGENARFTAPGGITWLNGELWVTDSGNHLVRRIQFMPAETVEEPVRIGIALHPAVTIEGEIGKTYRIFYSVQMDPPHWNLAATVVLTASPFKWIDPQAAEGRRRFYMVVPASP